VSVRDVIALPGVVEIGGAYALLKFTRYAILMWLPFYLVQALGYDAALAGYVSSSFEMGGMVGTPLIGYLSDQYLNGRRDLAAGVFMLGSCFTLAACVAFAEAGPGMNSLLMFLTGILIIGPDSVLSGTIAQDIGQRSGLGKAAVGTVAGFLNSVGSCGSVFQAGLTAVISREFGWRTLWAVFVVASGLSAAVLLNVAGRGRGRR